MGAESITENISVVKNSEVVIIGVKPQIIPVALGELQKASGLDTNKLFLSIAMGVTINQLEQVTFVYFCLVTNINLMYEF